MHVTDPDIVNENLGSKGLTVLIVGAPGTRKTTVAAQFPGPIFLSIASEGGDDALKLYPDIASDMMKATQMKECPPVLNTQIPPRFEIRTCKQFDDKVDAICKNHRQWGVCTVVVDGLNYLIDLWIEELIEVKQANDKSWMQQVKNRGGEFLGPPEYGLLNMFLRSARVRLSNHGLNVIWNCLSKQQYKPSNTRDPYGEQHLFKEIPMIVGANRVTLPGSCKLQVLAERTLMAETDMSLLGKQKMIPIWHTHPTSSADWIRHKYYKQFPYGKLMDPEWGEVPTFRAFWMALHPYIYTGQ